MTTTGNLVYDTNKIVHIVRNLKLAQSFLLDKFFPNIVTSDTEFVSIDIDIGKRRISPFVSPLNQGKLVEQRRYQTNTFKPAYIKDKRAPDLRKPIRRQIGERIGGEFSGAEREMANLAFEIADQMDMLTRRLEWMAAQELMFGTVTIAGDGFPTTIIDFGRPSSNTIALTGSAQWSVANVVAGTATPAANIEAWQYLVLKSSGALVTDIIMTQTPYQGFLADPLVRGAVFYPRWGEDGNVLNPGAQIQRGAVMKGMWGQYRIWIYNDWYIDDNNIEQRMVPDGTIIMGGPDIEGIRAFAQIIDPDFNYAAMPFAPKTWVEKDPAQRIIMLQSSPLPILSRPGASLAATVVPGVLT
jgi:hypothetical protein